MEIKNLKLKIKNFKKGFTLVETLVATFVLVTAIVGPLSIVAKGVAFSNIAKDQITAFYLAQEAIEYIRNKRDNNTIALRSWNNFKTSIIDACFDRNSCKIDVTDDTISVCGGGDCPYLNNNSLTGLFGYTSGGNWSQSPFRRTIKVYNEPSGNPNANEIRITVEMAWQSGTLTKNFVLKDNLLNWQ